MEQMIVDVPFLGEYNWKTLIDNVSTVLTQLVASANAA